MKKFLASLIVSLISLALPLCGSLLVGLAFYLMIKVFWVSVLLSFVGLFGTGVLWNTFIAFKAKQYMRELEMAQKIVDAYQEIEIGCASCNSVNITKILLNIDNEFKCLKCGVTNAVLMNFSTAAKSNPLTKKDEKDIQDKIHKLTDKG